MTGWSTKQKLWLAVVTTLSLGTGLALAMAPARPQAIGVGVLGLVATVVGTVRFGAASVLWFRSGHRWLGLLNVVLTILLALLALGAIGYLLQLFDGAAT